MHNDIYIDSPDKLAAFVDGIAQAPVLAIDTEFIREKTYYPQLCLIQLATEDVCAIIDPLAIADLSLLKGPFADPGVTKVFHAADQDCAIIGHVFGIVPKPLFDVQKAAALLGFPQQVSLGVLINDYCSVRLAKAGTYSDWRKRPLSDQQLAYAYDDVRYLARVYRMMLEKLGRRDRLSWLNDEFEAMTDPAAYVVTPEDSWTKVKHTRSLSAKQLAVLKAASAWRERTAQSRDLPRRWVLTDEQLIELSRVAPATTEALYEVRGVRERLTGAEAASLLASVRESGASEAVEPVRQELSLPRAADLTPSMDLMVALVHLRASENDVSSAVLANQEELRALAAGSKRDLQLLEGWRFEMVGRELLSLLKGELSLHLEQGRLKVRRIGDEAGPE